MNMQKDKSDRKLVEQAVALGHAFGFEVVAEGVEDEETAQQLVTLGCDYAQGFLFTKPLPPEEFTAWLQAWRSAPKS
jgi:EAL domain-containing protein (putative c-di-GMP-specific phosphodiesterase class I)